MPIGGMYLSSSPFLSPYDDSLLLFPLLTAIRLSLRTAFIGCMCLTLTIFSLLVGRYFDIGDPVMMSLALMNVMSITDNLGWMVRMIAEAEMRLNSVERMEQYASTPPEAPRRQLRDARLPPHWPRGHIVFADYQMRYREGLDLVLRGVSLEIEAGEKVGICGRTGAGKSSILNALFRICESTGGRIEMDGVDIATLGLDTLRSRMTIITQDPCLFAGTVRENIDPFATLTDVEVWHILSQIQLKDKVAAMEGQLEAAVLEGGSNFLAGEKQLLCLGRALTKQSKVVLLDEATASCDMETDTLIQQVVRTAFKEATVITIAHRLETIMDSDKLVVMRDGTVEAVGPPSQLLHTSFFQK